MVRYYGYEYDIFAEDWNILRGSRYLVVECKNKETVTTADMAHFIAKVHCLCRRVPELKDSAYRLRACLCYSGELAREAAIIARGHTPPIELLRIR